MKLWLAYLVVPLLALTLLVACVPPTAMPDNWLELGAQQVDFRAEKDEIVVGRQGGAFRQIKLVVEDAGVHFNDVVVVFGNGDRFDVPIRDNIAAGEETRAIDLPGEARAIKKIILKYKTRQGAGDKATVRVLGYRG